MGDKFDFTTATTLVQAVEAAASALDVKNGQMEKHFGNLAEGFRDSGYDAYASDMSAADSAIQSVIEQLHAVASSVAAYAQKLQDEV